MDFTQKSEEEDKNRGGRPSKYDPKFAKLAFQFSLLGATDVQLADFLEVHIDTISAWKNDFPKFSAAIKRGKAKADSLVSKSLFQRACGFEYEEKTFEDVLEPRMDLNGNLTHVPVTHVKTVKKYMPPETVACIFWLKNRQPALWRDRQHFDLTNDGHPFTLKVQPSEAPEISNGHAKPTLNLPINGHK